MFFRPRRSWFLLLIAAGVVLLGFEAKFGREEAAPEPAIPALLRAFDHHPVVMLGESHWSRAAGEFYLSLVRAAEFPDRVNTVVLECGSSQYQPVLDRYMNGEDVPFEQLSQVWRNTSKTISWDSPIYANLITALRDVNRGLPPTRRLRVLAAAPPIDWNRIHTRAEWLEASGEDKWFAELIQREVLDKKRKALVIMGANHVTHGGNWRDSAP